MSTKYIVQNLLSKAQLSTMMMYKGLKKKKYEKMRIKYNDIKI